MVRRRAYTTPNDGPPLELERSRLKTWSNLISRLLRRHGQHIYHIFVQGGLRRGGLTPACGFAHACIGEERFL